MCGLSYIYLLHMLICWVMCHPKCLVGRMLCMAWDRLHQEVVSLETSGIYEGLIAELVEACEWEQHCDVKHCQSCVFEVLSVGKCEHLWLVTVCRVSVDLMNSTLLLALRTMEREVLNCFLLLFCVSSKVSLSWEKMLWPILDTGWGWGWYADWEILVSLDRCGRALCCYLEVCLLLQVGHGWGEKCSECFCMVDL